MTEFAAGPVIAGRALSKRFLNAAKEAVRAIDDVSF